MQKMYGVLMIFFIAISLLAGCGESSSSRSSSTTKKLPTVYTYCPECEATGMPANVWIDQEMSSVACTIGWNQRVPYEDVSDVNGGMVKIRSNNCKGWIRISLVKE